MLNADLDRERGVLTLRPEGALTAQDFAALAGLVDPHLDAKGDLKGLLLLAPRFPGWEDFAGLVSHLKFVRDHHRRIRRIAVVSDSTFLSVAPKIAAHFVSAELKTFAADAAAAAQDWILS